MKMRNSVFAVVLFLFVMVFFHKAWAVPRGWPSILGPVVLRGQRGCAFYVHGSREICRMDQIQAQRFCENINRTALPTARQLAVIAHGWGGCRILSPEEYERYPGTSRCPKSAYKRVSVAPSSQEPQGDEFYQAESDNYRPRFQEWALNIFWSSSVATPPSDEEYSGRGRVSLRDHRATSPLLGGTHLDQDTTRAVYGLFNDYGQLVALRRDEDVRESSAVSCLIRRPTLTRRP